MTDDTREFVDDMTALNRRVITLAKKYKGKKKNILNELENQYPNIAQSLAELIIEASTVVNEVDK